MNRKCVQVLVYTKKYVMKIMQKAILAGWCLSSLLAVINQGGKTETL